MGLGDGSQVNFWTDDWISHPIADLTQVPAQFHDELKAKDKDFIVDNAWIILDELENRFPDVYNEIQQTVIPFISCADQLIWQGTETGELSFKEAFSFLNPSTHPTSWGKLLWSSCTPHSKSFLSWRLLHNKLPCDDNLRKRGCITVSMCYLCGVDAERAFIFAL